MFEIIGILLSLLWNALWFCLKILFRISPIFLILIAFLGGASLGNEWFVETIYGGYVSDVVDDYSHRVTVYWDEECTESDSFYVREDFNWAFNERRLEYSYDDVRDFDLYTDYQVGENILPDKASRQGYRFIGLFSSPYGVEQYVDANGYSMKTVKSDISLYAMWEKE